MSVFFTDSGHGIEVPAHFADAFAANGGLQCGFCIPGIVMRAKAQIDKKGNALTRDAMKPHLGAHLCRCTGWNSVVEACVEPRGPAPDRDLDLASDRAAIEGGTAQTVAATVALRSTNSVQHLAMYSVVRSTGQSINPSSPPRSCSA